MSKQMPRVDLKWVGRCCLSIVTLGHPYPLSRMSVHHLLRYPRRKLAMKIIISFLHKKKINWAALDKSKRVYSQMKMHLKNFTKIENYKKDWSAKYQRINTQPIKTKTIKYTRTLRYTWITLIKLTNTKTWTWRNTKQTWTLLNAKN